MSYEGYTQAMCKNGHYVTWDAYNVEFGGHDNTCTICFTKFVWTNDVDQTNGDGSDMVKIEIAKPAKTCICDCGNKHIIEQETYKIPKR